MKTEPHSAIAQSPGGFPGFMLQEEEISILDEARVLLGKRNLICLVTGIATLVAAFVAFLLPPMYSGEAVIVPPQQTQSAATSMMGQFGGLTNLGVAGFGWRNPADLYVGILKSRTILDAVIGSYRLQSVYGDSRLSDTRKHLLKRTTFTNGRDLLIHIRVDDHDPQRAADLANAYVDQLHAQNSRLALTEASQRRLLFEQQLAQEKDALADSETALKNAELTTGLVLPAGQAEALIRSGAQYRAEITSKELQLQAMRSYATDQNPRVQVLERQLATLQARLKAIEATGERSGGMEVPAAKLPAASLMYLRSLRDVKYHEALYEFLAKQYEAARIDEAKSAPLIQIVDRAVRPDKRSGPPRLLIVVGTGVCAALLICGYVLFNRFLESRSRQNRST